MFEFLTVLFILLSLLLFYTYFGYPILLWLLSKSPFCKRSSVGAIPTIPPSTLLITLHNEAAILDKKIANLLETKFDGQLDIVFVLDGCTDSSRSLIESNDALKSRFQVLVHATATRTGKEKALREAVGTIETPILVFSDADSMYQPHTIEKLVVALVQPGVGAACGNEVQVPLNSSGAGEGNGLFYRYENKIKKLLNHVSSLTYIQGGVFAMWREDYPESIPEGLTQDGVIAFELILKNKSVDFVEDAKSTEIYALSTRQDFERRIRTITRAFASILRYWRVLLPWKTGAFGFHLLSHRVLRWWTLPLMVAVLALNLSLIFFDRWFFVPLLGQIIFWVAAFVGWRLEKSGRRLKAFYIPFYFVYLHVAAAIGVFNAMAGRRISIWNPSQRPVTKVAVRVDAS